MLSEGLKCYFRDPIFQNLPRVHAPGPPWQLAPSVLGIAPPPPPLISLTLLRHCKAIPITGKNTGIQSWTGRGVYDLTINQ